MKIKGNFGSPENLLPYLFGGKKAKLFKKCKLHKFQQGAKAVLMKIHVDASIRGILLNFLGISTGFYSCI